MPIRHSAVAARPVRCAAGVDDMSGCAARWLLTGFLVLAAGCATVPEQAAGLSADVSGSFGRWRVRDAVAIRDDSGISLAFSHLRFDRPGWVDDAEFALDDLQRVIGNEFDYSPQWQLRLGDKGELLASRSRYGDYDAAWLPLADREAAFELRALEPGRIAGFLRIDDPADPVRIEFDLPVVELGALPRPGIRLPADGGDPGRWLLARSSAVWNGDLDGLLRLMSPAERSSAAGGLRFDPVDVFEYVPGDIETSGSSLFMLKQRMSMPQIERILGGSLHVDTAWVDFAGSDGVIAPASVTGTAVLRRDRRGNWSIERIVTHEKAPGVAFEAPARDKGAGVKKTVAGEGGAGDVPRRVCFGRNVLVNGRPVEPSCKRAGSNPAEGSP